jgi:uncharacterized membrane protein
MSGFGFWEAVIVFFILGIFVLITILIVVYILQGFATRRARMSVEREEAYHELADQATNAMQKTAEGQEKIAAGVEDLRARVAAIEKMLREVD